MVTPLLHFETEMNVGVLVPKVTTRSTEFPLDATASAVAVPLGTVEETLPTLSTLRTSTLLILALLALLKATVLLPVGVIHTLLLSMACEYNGQF